MLKNIDLSKVSLQYFAEEDAGDGGDKVFPSWMDQLPEDLKKDEDLSQFGNIGELAKSRNEVVAERDQFKAEADGREKPPEKAEGYEFEKQDVVEGYERNEDATKSFKEIFLKHGITKSQASGLFLEMEKKAGDQQADSDKKYSDVMKEEDEALKKEWGPNYAENMTKADRVKEHEAFKAEIEEMKIKGVDITRPHVLKLLVSMYKHISEGSLDESVLPHGTPVISEEEQQLRDRYPKSSELYPENQGEDAKVPESSVGLDELKQRYPKSPELWGE